MSSWFIMLLGLALGFIIGLFFGRKNYESCREQIQKLEGKIQARKAERNAATSRRAAGISATDDSMSAAIAETQQAAAGETGVTATVGALQADTGLTTATEKTMIEQGAGEAGTVAAQMAPDEEIPTDTVPVTAAAEETGADTTRGEGIEAVPGAEGGRISHCPQKLARIKGIGRVYEDKLYQAGIGTFWQVATTDDVELSNIFGIKDFQAVDLSAIKQGAMELAEATGTVGKVWSGESPDDLESLPGIGKTYEARLYDAGICTWKKLATLTAEELADILKAPQWSQPDYAAWIAFAQEHLS